MESGKKTTFSMHSDDLHAALEARPASVMLVDADPNNVNILASTSVSLKIFAKFKYFFDYEDPSTNLKRSNITLFDSLKNPIAKLDSTICISLLDRHSVEAIKERERQKGTAIKEARVTHKRDNSEESKGDLQVSKPFLIDEFSKGRMRYEETKDDLSNSVSEPMRSGRKKSKSKKKGSKNTTKLDIYEESKDAGQIPTQESKPEPLEKPSFRNKKDDMKLYGDSDDELEIRKIFLQHQRRDVEEFASEKITEKHGTFLQSLNDPFCPPAMQFHNSKEQSKRKVQHKEQVRKKRQDLMGKIGTAARQQVSNPSAVNSEMKPKSILKPKSAAMQYQEENKSADILISQGAMKEILNELSFLRKKIDTMEKTQKSPPKHKSESSKSKSPPRKEEERKSTPTPRDLNSSQGDMKSQQSHSKSSSRKRKKKKAARISHQEPLEPSASLDITNEFDGEEFSFDESKDFKKASKKSKKDKKDKKKSEKSHKSKSKHNSIEMLNKNKSLDSQGEQLYQPGQPSLVKNPTGGTSTTIKIGRSQTLKPEIRKFNNQTDFLKKFEEETQKKPTKVEEFPEEDITSYYTSEFTD